MTRPPFEVADIVRRHGDRFLETHRAWVSGQHRRVLRAIAQCRTAALGGHRDRCDQCAQPALSYNSCRDRHCPKCLTAARNAWVAAREQELLPVGYVHIVFTMPEPLARLALVNKRVVYDLLFQAAAETLLEVATNPKRWGRDWRTDGPPHVGPAPAASSPHPLRRAGGRLVAGRHPVDPRAAALLSARYGAPAGLSRQARRRLTRAFRRGALVSGRLEPLATDGAFRAFLRSLYGQPWVVYAKPPFGSPAHVLHYLARYTHRVAISNHRLVAVIDDTVSFRWKDYRHGNQVPDAHARRRRIPPPIFLHVFQTLCPDPLLRLPGLAVSDPATRTVSPGAGGRAAMPVTDTVTPHRSRASWPCPRCGAPMRLVERLTARQLFLDTLLTSILHDTS